ncbi:Glycosyltransferase involved in cell wall bisynthesis [Flavobacteriaceae bacterium MAR_2010_188]|nr:Glycosyltransferase involved in cell wall bisynthesis [Flavobacteriaceae bacterium MAR_2010_188]
MNSKRTINTNPLVSVVIPCFNQAEFLEEALTSVLEQDYQNWECLLVNDGSDDNTEGICNKWIAKDPRFQYYAKKNSGLSATRNYGIVRSNGKYILPLDADDKISPNYLKECVSYLEGSQQLSLVYGKVEQFGTRTGPWELGEYSYLDLLAYNMIHCCAMYPKSKWKEVGGYDEKMRQGLEDWEFWIKLLENNGQAVLLSQITFHYRIKDVSMITLMDKKSFRETRAYVLKKHADIYMENLYDMVMEKRKFEGKISNVSFLYKKLFRTIFYKNHN